VKNSFGRNQLELDMAPIPINDKIETIIFRDLRLAYGM
jgi:hypothetical protein